ncbi:MAG: fibronectin type III domain-containing protein [Saprospiraceae bacterium]|nr:fibronectin type III domain-containing protein [Saprospiraceae bacterium]
MTTFQILLTVLVAAALAFWAGVKFSGNPTSCPAPTNLQVTKDNDRLEVNLSWAAAASASGYLILVSDSQDVNNIIESQISETNTFTLRNLPAGKSYVVSVYSKCGNSVTGEVNPVPVQESFNTNDWIIIVDDVVHVRDSDGQNRMNDTICPKTDICSPISNFSNNRFSWGNAASGEEVYSIEIASVANPKTVLSRALIIKQVKQNKLSVVSHINVECSNKFTTFNEPRASLCYPQPTQAFCGSFTDGTSGVPYRVECDLLGCRIVFPNAGNASNYIVTVKSCVAQPNQ